jgi:hypothetical protein
LPSLHESPVRGVSVQLAVPLQARSRHGVLVQVTRVPPAHTPDALHASPYEHASPSSQLVPVRGVSVQVGPPLHARVMHVVLVHEMAVPRQIPAPQASPCVHASPSSHALAVRHAQTPPTLVHT